MENDLQKIDGLVIRDIPHLVEQGFQITPELILDFQRAIDEETEGIKERFALASVNYGETSIKHYFAIHEQRLISLSASLTTYAGTKIYHAKFEATDHAVLCQYLIATLEKLIFFISQQYTRFIDFTIWLPAGYRKLVSQKVKRNLKTLEVSIPKLEISPELATVALSPFKEFLDINITSEASYGRTFFLDALAKEIHALSSLKPLPNPSSALELKLLYLNFNSPHYFEYYTQKITVHYQEFDNIPQQLEQLAFFQKTLHQFQVMPLISYDFSRRPLKQQLLDWIDEEAAFLETKLNTVSRLNKSDALQPDQSDASKIKVNLSVGQVAFLAKVFVESNLVEGTNVVNLLRRVAKVFQTKRSGAIGYGSLYSRYYNVESGVRQAVRNLLQKLINHIDRTDGTA